MLQNLLFRKVFYTINLFTLQNQNLLFSEVLYAINLSTLQNWNFLFSKISCYTSFKTMQSSVYQRPPRRMGSPASFFRRQAQVFPSALRRADCLSVASFCPLAGGSTGVAGKTQPWFFLFGSFSFVSRRKKKNYSANIGSQAGSRIGFCFNTSRAFFDAYFVSTTRRNIYSLNQSSVIMR